MNHGDLNAQTRLVLSCVGDNPRGLERGFADLKLLTCYFASDGPPQLTQAFLDTIGRTLGGTLPLMTLVP